MMNELTNHKKDETALKADEASYFDRSGKLYNKPTKKGWQIEVDWKDGTSSWCTLSDSKESYSVQTAEYAIQNGLEDEPAFRWGVRYVNRKKERILKATKRNKYWMRTHKYGVEVPKTIKDALAIDRRTGTTY